MSERSCNNCFYGGCGIPSDLRKVLSSPCLEADEGEVRAKVAKVVAQACSQYRRKCPHCGAMVPTEAEFLKSDL